MYDVASLFEIIVEVNSLFVLQMGSCRVMWYILRI